MSAAAERAVARLGKTLALLASDHDGERASAGAAADRQLRALGLGWGELVQRAFRVPALPPPPCHVRRRPTFDPAAQLCWPWVCRRFLTGWEASFVESLRQQTWPLSARQRAKLAEVAQRVETRAGGGAE